MSENLRNDLVKAPKHPPTFCASICAEYGTNPYDESLWRVVWMPDRIFFNGGYWNEDGLFQYRKTRRYGTKPQWGLERWVPASAFGDPKTWAQRTMRGEGRMSQGAFPMYGSFLCTQIFTGTLTPFLLKQTLQSLSLGDLRSKYTTRDILLAQSEEKERESDESWDREWELVDNPRRGLTYTAGGRRVNENDNLILRKETEIAAATGGQFREATSGFSQVKSLEDLSGNN